MKLPKKVIDALMGNFHYSEVPEDAWNDDTWQFEDEPYYEQKQCWRLRNSKGVWIEVPDYLMTGPSKNRKENFDLEKACKWLNKNLSRVVSCYVQNEDSENEGDTHVVDVLKEDFLNDFRKYMEKQ